MKRSERKFLRSNGIMVMDILDLKGEVRDIFKQAWEARDTEELKRLIKQEKIRMEEHMNKILQEAKKEEELGPREGTCPHCGSENLYFGLRRNFYSPRLQCEDCGCEVY